MSTSDKDTIPVIQARLDALMRESQQISVWLSLALSQDLQAILQTRQQKNAHAILNLLAQAEKRGWKFQLTLPSP